MEYYSVEQVAELLDLHVKTVRGYVRDGRLRATRIGKQYRIARADLAEFTGAPPPPPAGAAPRVEVSSIVRIEDIDHDGTVRLMNTLTAVGVARSREQGQGRLRVETVRDEERATLQVIVLGDPESTAEVLRIIHALTESETPA